jgi:hypothetical protein
MPANIHFCDIPKNSLRSETIELIWGIELAFILLLVESRYKHIFCEFLLKFV